MENTLRFVKHFSKYLFTAFASYLVMLLFLAGSVSAYVYDDFTSVASSYTKWYEVGPVTGLFTQPDGGPVSFNSSSPNQIDSFVADNWITNTNPLSSSSSVTMQFSNFSQNSQNVWSGDHVLYPTSGMALGVSENNSIYEIIRAGTYWSNLGFGSDWFRVVAYVTVNGQAKVSALYNYFGTTATNGQMGINYSNPSQINFSYNDGSGWTSLDSVATGWSDVPYLLISGGSGNGSTSTSFNIEQVTISNAPVPASLLLLGPGLIGLAGLRRKFKN
jgi:hypothetical protein